MSEPGCQIVRTLDVVGEKWSLLIVRNALRGQTRFTQFRDQLGIPSDILSARLARLVEAGVLERRQYREPGSRERSSYHLTESGRGLRLVLAAMMQWSDEYRPAPQGVAAVVADPAGEALRLGFVDESGTVRDPAEAAIVPGPAATWRPEG